MYCRPASANDPITASIKPPSIQANMGDRIIYTGTITNNTDKPITNVIAYISLANVTQDKEAPMDLEDWNANKAIKIDSIPPRGNYMGQWPMRLIDSGSYVAYITVVDKNIATPISSTMSPLEIKRLIRLNPHNILPVAIGEPILIGAVFIFITFKRKKR
uniref:DUF11 domain-containing protein n=1 Tax=uncultured Desulfobacterium sp. TaxID=201089 RepID=E1YAW1_9BACT|nr:hypothetical protein N47_H25270 [uncultured Desulfobacterium sp.]